MRGLHRIRIKEVASLAAVFVLLGFLLGGCARGNDEEAPPAARGGLLDLTQWQLGRDGVVPLDGQWRYAVYGSPSGAGADRLLQVPGTWREGGEDDGRPDARGAGEYRLTLKGLPPETPLAIRLPNISTAYLLYVDGKPAVRRGEAGGTKADTTPYQLPATVYFTPSGERTELRLDVSNYHHRTGGIRTSLLLGTSEQISRLEFRKEATEMVVLGCLLMIGIYHLGLYALRRRELSNLYFALLCLFVAGRMSVIGEGFLMYTLPSLTWTASGKIEYTCFVLAGLFGFAYFQQMYPREIARRWVRYAAAVALVLVCATWSLSVLRFSSILPVYQLFILALCARALVGVVTAAVRRREGAKLALVGVAGLVATIVNDMLFYNGWWRSPDLVSFGLLFLITMNAFIISMRFSRTFNRAEQLSTELKEWNNLLEARISARTEEIVRMEQARRQLVSNISHDLRTPMTLLQGYLEALRDGVISDPTQRDATIRAMLKKVEGLNGLIQDLFELSLLEARRAQMSYVVVRLADWLSRLQSEYGMELREKGIVFRCEQAGEGFSEAAVRIDELRMDRVFANLIYNATRHTPPGGEIRLTFGASASGDEAILVVSDTGSGIRPGDLPHLFERFYQNDKSRRSSSGGSGLGLSIAREIVETHGGRISAENREEGGARFRIALPIHRQK
ncbi:cell wall metabolism sensor histidine kinase WalK [Cohnella sp. REN36]|uniref:sensor histidine kinase n=1 Tax=Cohnella sp. REN36 TaxID=2887347 RepID=UPI001D1501AD|nr:sensor histidine kinase [Cohnella sp. REN36]MCC3373288.1 sensor histidine kinase [Cohnella sp. REN36]